MNLLKNYELISTVASCILTIIILIVSIAKAIKDKKYSSVISYLPLIINEAEKIFENVSASGDNKLQYCINKVKTICAELKLSLNTDKIKELIEGYLSTPQKK